MNITELLENRLKTDQENICLNIGTVTDIFNICFLDYEDYEKIGVYITGTDGRERFMIIYKDQIVSLAVVYEGDIDFKPKQEEVMVQ